MNNFVNLKHPALIVLQALLQSPERELDNIFPGYKVSLQREDNTSYPVLCVTATQENNSEIKKEVYLPLNMSLSDFIKNCEELIEEELILISGNTSLQGYIYNCSLDTRNAKCPSTKIVEIFDKNYQTCITKRACKHKYKEAVSIDIDQIREMVHE